MGNGQIITDFEPVEEKQIVGDFTPISTMPTETGIPETYLTQGKEGEGLSIVDKLMDYLGIRKTPPKTIPLQIDATEKGQTDYQVREEVFGTGRQEEFRKVMQRGLAGATAGMTDLISKALNGEVQRPETTAGIIGGSLTELAGFILGPFRAVSLITGARLAPTAKGLKQTAQMMAKGAADLGIASGLSSIVPHFLESETLTEAGLKIGESTAIGGIVGAIFPTFRHIENKALRMAVGLAVMDKIRAGMGEWFTIDDIIVGIGNGTIDRKHLAVKAYDYLLDMYFISHVPSMKKDFQKYEHNAAIKEFGKINVEEVEKTIIELEKEGLIPGSEKREKSRVDEQVIDLVDIIGEGKKPEVELKEGVEPKEKAAIIAPEKISKRLELEAEEMKIINKALVEGLTDEEMKKLESLRIQQFEEVKKEGFEFKDVTRSDLEAERVKETELPPIEVKKEIPPIIQPLPEAKVEEIKPELSATEKDQFKLPGMKQKRQAKLFGTKPTVLEEATEPEITDAEIERIMKQIGVVDLPGWVREKGGFDPESRAADVFELTQKESGFRGKSSIVRKGGRAPDVLRDEAEREGMIAPGTSTDEFVDMIKSQVRARGLASVGKYRSSLPMTMDLPEIVKLAKDLMGGKYPEIREKLRAMKGAAEGVFWPKGEGKMALKAEIFKDINQAKWVASHEIGHLVDYLPDEYMKRGNILGRIATLKKYLKQYYQGVGSNKQIKEELINITQTIKPFNPDADPKFTKYRYKPEELYADAISSLVNNPILLKQTAPKFYDGLFEYMDRKPEVAAEYEAFQDAIKSGTNQAEAVKDLRESFRKGDEKWFESVRKEPNVIDDLKAGVIDKDHYLLKRIRPIEKNLSPGENPRYLLEDMRYFADEPDAYLMDIYQQVKKPMEKAGASWEDFREWAFHQRIINERGEIANPMGWHPDRSKQRIAEMKIIMPTQMQAIEKAHEAFWKLRQEFFINRAKALNIFSPELMDRIADNEFYATFDLQKYFGDVYGQNTGAKIYKQVGTFQEIGDPIAATVMKDISLMRSMSRIRAARSVIDVFKNQFPNEIKDADTMWAGKGRRILDPKEPGQYLIVDMVGGKAKGYYVPEYIGNSFERNPLESSVVARILRKTVQPFRTVFTEVNYGFWLFNVHRDYFRAVKNLPSANMVNFIPYYLEGIKPAFRSAFKIPDDVIREMNLNHELISMKDRKGMVAEDMQIERLLKSYHIIPFEWNNKILKPFGQFFNFFTNVGRAVERIPKVGADLYLREKFPGMDPEVRAHIVRNAGSTDFLRQGIAYPIYNNLLLFSNAMKEGYRGDYEALSRSPSEYMWKTAKYNFLPKILMKAGAIGLLGTAIKEIYDKATEYDKTNYSIIPIGKTPSGKAVYWRIPQDETGRFLGGVLWKIMEGEFDPMKGGLIDYMAGQAPTVHPMLDVMTDVVSYYSGQNPYDHFRGQQAIPELVFKANDFRTTEAFLKYIVNKLGVGIIHRFKSDSDVEIRTELEKLINYPVLSNILGRFVKVTDYGEKEHIKQDILQPIQEKRAREIIDAHEAIQKMVTGEQLSSKDQVAILREEMLGTQVVNRNIMAILGRRYGTAYSEALLTASTKEEKIAILKEIMEKQGGSK